MMQMNNYGAQAHPPAMPKSRQSQMESLNYVAPNINSQPVMMINSQ
jgi:hypothetical protein